MPTSPAPVLTRPAPTPDRTLAYGTHQDQVADVWLPNQATRRAVILLLHGGFWRPAYDRVHTRAMAAALRDAGWPVASLEYRRIPGRPDTTMHDVRAALATLPGLLQNFLPLSKTPRRTLLVGHSAGGHLALWAAAACPPDNLEGTVALAPVADLTLAHAAGLGNGAVADFLGAAPETRPDLDTMGLPTPRTLVTILHGADDPRVPLEVSESYLKAHPAARLVTIPDTGHFELIDPLTSTFSHVLATLGTTSENPPAT